MRRGRRGETLSTHPGIRKGAALIYMRPAIHAKYVHVHVHAC